LILEGCGGIKPSDARKTPTNALERARKNVEEGKGITLGGMVGRGGTNYEFSTSNPMWRASLEILDFLPLSTVDYSGGVIVSDWYNDSNNFNDSLKITVRFLSNEIKTNSLKIVVHKKTCKTTGACSINLMKSKIPDELTRSILSKAVEIEKQQKIKK
jgi:hypothetical protein